MYSIEAREDGSPKTNQSFTDVRVIALLRAKRWARDFKEVRVYRQNNKGQVIRQVVCYINGKEKVYN